MPNLNRFDILSISIFCKIALSISIFSKITISILISISIFLELPYRYQYRYRYFSELPYRYRYFSKVSIYRQSIYRTGLLSALRMLHIPYDWCGSCTVLITMVEKEKKNIQGVPKNVLIGQNHIQNWKLPGCILPWIWLGKAWSGLVLVRNDQKINFQTQGEPAACDWASALWLQPNSILKVPFFGTPCSWIFDLKTSWGVSAGRVCRLP